MKQHRRVAQRPVDDDLRVLVLAPRGRDAAMVEAHLVEAGIPTRVCASVEVLIAEIAAGAGVVVVTDTVLQPEVADVLRPHVADERAWSDLPFVLLTNCGRTREPGAPRADALGPDANVTLLERPLRPVTLVHAVRAALRARRCQYALRDHRARMYRVERIAAPGLASGLPVDDVVRELLSRLCDALGADTAIVLTTVGENGETVLRARAALGLDDAARRALRVPVGHGFAGRIAARREPKVVERLDADRDEGTPDLRHTGLHALAGVPLLTEEGLLGVLLVGSRRAWRVRAEDVDLVRMAAERIAAAIERARRRDAEREARRTAETADRAKAEFLALFGHELRNPLAALASALLIARFDDGHRDRALEIARRQAFHLAQLVDDLLDVARLTQGRIALRREPISLGQVVERAVEATRTWMEDRRHEVRVSLPEDALLVDADPMRLEQIATNLLTNAAKYTQPGGHVDVVVAREGDAAVLRVRDDGMGVTPELLPRIFDLFSQGDRPLDRSQGGLGLGLSVVKRLVELHGGSVAASSAGPGAGSEFSVRLPVLIAAPAPAPRPAPAPAPARSHARVLIVEDNPDASDALYMLLELLGHDVRVVHDGPAAIDAVRDAAPDVAIVDIGLPGMDGYEVARRARPLAEPGRMTLIALTGYGRDEDKARAYEAGFDHHLTKPVDMDTLRTLLNDGPLVGPQAAH